VARGDVAKLDSVEHVHALVENALGYVRLTQAFVDFGRPGEGGLARISTKDIIDGGAARQDASNDGEQTENHQTGHDQPIPSADFCHFREFPIAVMDWLQP
jgi:hypothetical protein